MIQILYGLKTNKGTYLSVHQIGNQIVESFEHKKNFHGDLWEDNAIASHIEKLVLESRADGVLDISSELFPLSLTAYQFEEKETDDAGFKIIGWTNFQENEESIDLSVHLRWNEEVMNRCNLESPYVVVSVSKEGEVSLNNYMFIDDGGYSSGYNLSTEDIKKVEAYLTSEISTILKKYNSSTYIAD